jgi:SAM-dependent methyltransferase
VLDVGCGTGRAFAPLISRGWNVFGCDVSEGMLAIAKEKYPDVPLLRADATDLPAWGFEFDFILLLGDVVNYLTEDGDLERCFEGVARNLAPGGLCLFDTNTIGQMRKVFGGTQSRWMSIGGWKWRGTGTAIVVGGTFEAELSGTAVEPRIHRQRHWTPKQVRDAETEAGLECLALLGQREEGMRILMSEDLDEERDPKAIHIVRRVRQ